MNSRRSALPFATRRFEALPLYCCVFLAAAQLLASCSNTTSSEKVDAGHRKYCDAYCADGARHLPDTESAIDLSGADSSSSVVDGGQDSTSADSRVVPIDSAISDAPISPLDGPNDNTTNTGETSGTGGAGGTAGTGGMGGTAGAGGVIDAGGDARLDVPIGTADVNPDVTDIRPDSADVPADGADASADASSDGANIQADSADVPPDSTDVHPDVADVPPSLDVTIGQDAAVTSPDGGALSCLVGNSTFAAQQWTPTLRGMAAGSDGTLWAAGAINCPNGTCNQFAFPDPGSGTGPSIVSSGLSDVFLAKLNPSTGLVETAFTYGDMYNNDQDVTGVAVASNGNVGIIGNYTNEIDFTQLNSDGSANPDGTIGNAGVDYLLGGTGINFYAVLTASNTPVKSHKIDVGSGQILSVAANPGQTAFAICGFTTKLAPTYISNNAGTSGIRTTIGTYGGGNDIVVAKIDAATGLVLWGEQFGGAGDQLCQSVAMDNAGNVIIAGSYNGTLQFGSLAAFPSDVPSTASLLYVAVLDGSAGVPMAAQTWGAAPDLVTPNSLAVDASNNIIVAGSLSGSLPFGSPAETIASVGQVDAFVVKLTVNGTAFSAIWTDSFGRPSKHAQAKSVATSSNGDVYLAGLFDGSMGAMNLTSFSPNNADGFVARLNGQTGGVLCAQVYGDAATVQEADYITVARAASGPLTDAVSVGGVFSSTISFGATRLSVPLTVTAFFVAGLSP